MRCDHHSTSGIQFYPLLNTKCQIACEVRGRQEERDQWLTGLTVCVNLSGDAAGNLSVFASLESAERGRSSLRASYFAHQRTAKHFDLEMKPPFIKGQGSHSAQSESVLSAKVEVPRCPCGKKKKNSIQRRTYWWEETLVRFQSVQNLHIKNH